MIKHELILHLDKVQQFWSIITQEYRHQEMVGKKENKQTNT